MPTQKNKNDKDIKKKEPKLYTVIADAVIPIKAKYTIMAEDEKEAIKLIKEGKFKTISIDRPKLRINNIIQLTVFIGNSITRLLSVRLK